MKFFMNTRNVFSSKKHELLEEGIRRAIKQQQAIIRQGLSLIAHKTIVFSGPFRHAFIPNTADVGYFSHPLALSRLANFVTESLTVRHGLCT